MDELRESKLKPKMFDPYLTSLSYDLMAVYKIAEDRVEKVLARGVKEGWSPERIIKEVGDLFSTGEPFVAKSAAVDDGMPKPILGRQIGTAGSVRIFRVDGMFVRDTLDINFTEGGHDLVYRYIPKKTIWIDNDVRDEEIQYIVIHEVVERIYMEAGYTYEDAHRKTTMIEAAARRDSATARMIVGQFEIKIGGSDAEV